MKKMAEPAITRTFAERFYGIRNKIPRIIVRSIPTEGYERIPIEIFEKKKS